MKTYSFILVIFLSIFYFSSSTSAGEKWTNVHFKKTTGELVSDTYLIKIPNGFCQVDINPTEKDVDINICGRAVDYSKSTEDKSLEIHDRFSIIDSYGWIRIARRVGTLTTTDEGDDFVKGKGYQVFSKKCLPLVKGSNIPLIAQETLRELE